VVASINVFSALINKAVAVAVVVATVAVIVVIMNATVLPNVVATVVSAAWLSGFVNLYLFKSFLEQRCTTTSTSYIF
jgi:hypothetical protein